MIYHHFMTAFYIINSTRATYHSLFWLYPAHKAGAWFHHRRFPPQFASRSHHVTSLKKTILADMENLSYYRKDFLKLISFPI